MDDFPRAMYQASLEKVGQRENRNTEQREEETTVHNPQGEGRPQQENNRSETTGERNARGQETDCEEIRRERQFPRTPGARRPNPDSRAYGGWDVIDSLTVTQCAVRPPGMQTVEIIPNSLQEEWTEAWNAAHMQRQIAET